MKDVWEYWIRHMRIFFLCSMFCRSIFDTMWDVDYWFMLIPLVVFVNWLVSKLEKKA